MPTNINPSGQTINQYNVQTGAASNLLNNVAPSATSGIPLVSQGASAQPIFSTVGVAGGGTGATSFTAYSVVTGGTTSTGALQNVSGVGVSGQVLTSNGASTLPTWQTPAGAFSPSTIMRLQDDFTGVSSNSSLSALYSDLTWGYGVHPGNDGLEPTATTEAGHPGILKNNTQGTSQPNFVRSSQSFILGGGPVTLNWIIKLTALSSVSNSYELKIGFTDVYFYYLYTVNSGNWVLTSNSGATTTVNTATAVTTGWHNFQIAVNADATSITFSLDGVAIGSAITTNIPTDVQQAQAYINSTSGNVGGGTFLVDAFYMTYEFIGI